MVVARVMSGVSAGSRGAERPRLRKFPWDARAPVPQVPLLCSSDELFTTSLLRFYGQMAL